MRIAVGLLTCLAAGALTSAFGDPATPQPATSAAPAESAAEKPAGQAPAEAAPAAQAPSAQGPAAPAAASKEEIDQDTRHFLAEGFKPEMHGGQQLYCRKEIVVGSRLSAVKNCGTIGELKINEQRAKSGVSEAQRQQGH